MHGPQLLTSGVLNRCHMTQHHMQGIGQPRSASQQKSIVTLRLLFKFVIGTAEEVLLRSILISSPASSIFIPQNISHSLLGSTYHARHFCQFPWEDPPLNGTISFFLAGSPLQDTVNGNHIGSSIPVTVNH